MGILVSMLYMVLLVYLLHLNYLDSSLISRICINNCETKNQILYSIVIVHCPSIHLIAI